MKQTVLGQSPLRYKKALDRKIHLSVLTAVFAVMIHVFLTLTRTQNNHNLLLWCNIGCDVICGWLLVYLIYGHIIPCRRLFALYSRDRQPLEATVTGISPAPMRYMDMDCLEISTTERRLFLPGSTIRLQEGQKYRFAVVSNMIMEAEQ